MEVHRVLSESDTTRWMVGYLVVVAVVLMVPCFFRTRRKQMWQLLCFIHTRRERLRNGGMTEWEAEQAARRIENAMNRNSVTSDVARRSNASDNNNNGSRTRIAMESEESRSYRWRIIQKCLTDYTLDISDCIKQTKSLSDEEQFSDVQDSTACVEIHVPEPGVNKIDSNDSKSSRRSVPNECVICIEPLLCSSSNSKRIVWSSNGDCKHCFHEECIHSWLSRKTKFPNIRCPCCRADFISKSLWDDMERDEKLAAGTNV
mmetsp:Transcript_15966/g.20893  ORF Transcript_15966/g.20893 Transcript_15966/m.20893 type:complete len:260 (+) Transcript_15966:139-918(+)